MDFVTLQSPVVLASIPVDLEAGKRIAGAEGAMRRLYARLGVPEFYAPPAPKADPPADEPVIVER